MRFGRYRAVSRSGRRGGCGVSAGGFGTVVRYYATYSPGLSLSPLTVAAGPAEMSGQAYLAGQVDEVAVLRQIIAPLRTEMGGRTPPRVPRVWVVFATAGDPGYMRQETKVLIHIDAIGGRRDVVQRGAGGVSL